MRHIFLSLILLFSIIVTEAVTITVNPADGRYRPIFETAEPVTGLSGIIVVDNTAGATVTFNSEAPGSVSASAWSNTGAAYSSPLAVTTLDDGSVTLTLSGGDTGLTFDVAGDRSYHYWITDYSRHHLSLKSLALDPQQSDCMMAGLTLTGDASPIWYYTINGARRSLSRDMTLEYASMAYDEDSQVYNLSAVTKTIGAIDGTLHIEQPLCDTSFTLSGDRFSAAWGESHSVSSPTYPATAVEATATATNLDEVPDNMSSAANPTGGLGGSAPAEIRFSAAVTPAAVYTEWQLSSSPDFIDIDYRFNQPEVSHTFTEYGTTYARFVCANNSGDCQYTSQTFEINIGASKLVCPNAFSPADQNGVNDEWRVTYASLVEFECNIFNSWGVHIIKLTSPEQGWDGRYGGKFVPSGVYYYVIRAKGADGVDYKLAGDINIINAK